MILNKNRTLVLDKFFYLQSHNTLSKLYTSHVVTGTSQIPICLFKFFLQTGVSFHWRSLSCQTRKTTQRWVPFSCILLQWTMFKFNLSVAVNDNLKSFCVYFLLENINKYAKFFETLYLMPDTGDKFEVKVLAGNAHSLQTSSSYKWTESSYIMNDLRYNDSFLKICLKK